MIILSTVLILFLVGPVILGLYNRKKYKIRAVADQVAKHNILVNSAVLYALAFNLIFFMQELFLVIGKIALGLKAVLYHNNHTWLGEHPMMLLMQGSGAAAIFVTGFICLAIYLLLEDSSGVWKLFFLWLAFHGLLQSIPQVMVTYFDPNTDAGESLVGYLHLDKSNLMILALISLIACALLSIWFSGRLLQFATTDLDLNNPRSRLIFIQYIAAGAALAGSFIIIPFRIFPMSQAITPFIVFVFSIPWTWSTAAINKPTKRAPNRLNEKIYRSPIFILILLFIFFRMALAPGVAF